MSDSTEQMSSIYEYSVDIAGAEAPPPMPLGEYRATVRAVDNTTSKNSGKPMMVTTYLIPPDEYPADYIEGRPEGETGQTYFIFEDTPRGRFKMRKHCEMHGVTPAQRINSMDFIGQQVIIRVTHEEYQGEQRARFQPVRAA